MEKTEEVKDLNYFIKAVANKRGFKDLIAYQLRNLENFGNVIHLLSEAAEHYAYLLPLI